ncbi:permease [Dokdonia pacifica]|uniref:Threonine/homoserine efflux transporter RhtA n=1 Tax=Dokdonia pacifica TaxID=1627892 RepID=A0A238ZAN2_9FLAO|nr:DMT family transporter [Dokdonia pacifica]GGG05172.1 permease [Dokdonia pacifica]SNR80048.1 Threonine/homoserine efflux transporter RhtA [Dokdonia pacifica]
MTKKTTLGPILEINLAMLFISTSGVLGRYIQLPPELTIALRGIFAAVFLGLFILWRKSSWHIDTKDRKAILIGGILLGAHWVLYFYALQLSNVAIGMLSIFTYPVITSLLEPLVLKTKFHPIHIFLAILVLFGLYLLAPEFSLESDATLAIILGVISALCYALRNLIMKTKVQKYEGTILMWYQIMIVSVLLIPALFMDVNWPSVQEQLPYLALLGLLTTTIGHTLFLSSFKHFSVTTASLMSSAQPIYGIILGIFFLQEIPGIRTIIGGALILVSVVVESRRAVK